MSTIKDVAELAGVSVSTVSNFLNQKGNVSDKKYRKITSAIKELNYKPNLAARSMRKSNLKIVAVVMPSLNPFYSKVFEGIHSVLDPKEYQVILKLSDDNAHNEKKIIQDLGNLGIVGTLVVPTRPEHREQYAPLHEKKIPTVFLGRRSEKLQFSSVTLDNSKLIRSLTSDRLSKHAPDRLALIAGSEEYSSEKECIDAYRDALSERTETTDIESGILRCSLQKDFAFQSIYDFILSRPETPESIIVSSGAVAEVVAEVLDLAGIEGTEVHALHTDKWCRTALDGDHVHYLHQESLALGVEGANLLLENMSNPMVFESRNSVLTSGIVRRPAIEAVESAKKQTLRILMLKSDSSDALVKLARGYSLSSGCRLDFNLLYYQELQREITRSLGSGSDDYDVVMVDLPWINSFIEKGWLVNLSPYFEGKVPLENYNTKVQRAFSLRSDRLYGLPVIGTIQFLFYRKDIFEDPDIQWTFLRENGFALKVPENWTEFNIIAEFLNRSSNPGSPVEFGTALNGIAPIGLVDEFLPRQWSFNGRLVGPDGGFVLSSPENTKAVENFRKSHQISRCGDGDLWWDDEFKLLLDGGVAMVMGFASHFPTSAEDRMGSEHYGKIGVMPVPGNKPMLGGWVLGINRNSRSVDESFRFIRWATDNGTAVPALLLGGALPNIRGYENTRIKLHFPWFADMREGFRSACVREQIHDQEGRIIDPYGIDTVIADALQQVLDNKMEIETAFEYIENGIRSKRK